MSKQQVRALLDSFLKAKSENRVGDCVTICRQGTRVATTPGLDEWYGFRLDLGNLLLERSTSPSNSVPSDDIEEAISVFEELLNGLRQLNATKQSVMAAMGIALAYSGRIVGSHMDNLEKALDAGLMALDFIDKNDDPYLWAIVKTNVALIFSDAAQGASTRDRLEKAIEGYEQSLSVFSQSDYPEEWNDTVLTISELRERLRNSLTYDP